MTVIFEFELPTRDANTGASLNRKSWVNKFQALRDVAFGPTYNQQLQALTDLVTRRGSMPAKPGGNAIGQVRTNEIETSGPWQMREFHLQQTGGGLALRLAGTGQTPADEHVIPGTPEHQALADYINANAVAIRGGFAEVPASMIGGQSTEVEPWQFAVPVDEPARLSFAGQTCNGCHAVETANLQREGFYHVSPVADGGDDGTGRLSDLVKLFEIPRRAAFMQNQIACTGSACAPAAELVFLATPVDRPRRTTSSMASSSACGDSVRTVSASGECGSGRPAAAEPSAANAPASSVESTAAKVVTEDTPSGAAAERDGELQKQAGEVRRRVLEFVAGVQPTAVFTPAVARSSSP